MGTALSCVLAATGHRVVLWDRDLDVVAGIQKRHKNPRSLTSVHLDSAITAEARMPHALFGADVVVFAVASSAVREIAMQAKEHIDKNAVIVSVAKGIEEPSLLTMSGVLEEVLGARFRNQIVAFSGPTFALELATKAPTAAMLGSVRANAYADRAVRSLSAEWVRVYQTRDMIGVELSGVVKHVIALTIGIIDGLKYGDNTRAWVLMESFRELARLIWKRGGQQETVYGLAGMGDAVGASFAQESRNRQFGELIAHGKTIAQTLEIINETVEGVNAVGALHLLAQKEKMSLPVLTTMYSIIHGKKKAKPLFEVLLRSI